MQLRLTLDELFLLDDILHESLREFRERASQAESPDAQRRFGLDQAIVEALLAKVGVRELEFSADEFDGLSDLLAMWEKRTAEQISECENSAAKVVLQRRMSGVRGLRDKVTESCAMV